MSKPDDQRDAVAAEIDHVVTRPVLHWAQMWQDMAEAYPKPKPTDEIAVLLTGQVHVRDNGLWLVRADGSRRRP